MKENSYLWTIFSNNERKVEVNNGGQQVYQVNLILLGVRDDQGWRVSPHTLWPINPLLITTFSVEDGHRTRQTCGERGTIEGVGCGRGCEAGKNQGVCLWLVWWRVMYVNERKTYILKGESIFDFFPFLLGVKREAVTSPHVPLVLCKTDVENLYY